MVPHWDKFQHYRDRDPPWIKLYTDLVHRDEWRQLTCAECGLLVRIWLEFALKRGQVRLKDVPNLVGSSHHPRGMKALTDAGFLQLSASKPLPLTRARALATETETEEASPREASSGSLRSEEAASPPPPTHEATSAAPTLCPHCGLECKNAERLEEHLHNVHWDDPRNEQVDQAMQTAIKEWG